VGLAVILVIAVLAVVVWYKQPDTGRAERDFATGPTSGEQARKPALRPSGDTRDAPRGRPERERTDRPGDGRSSPR